MAAVVLGSFTPSPIPALIDGLLAVAWGSETIALFVSGICSALSFAS